LQSVERRWQIQRVHGVLTGVVPSFGMVLMIDFFGAKRYGEASVLGSHESLVA